MRGWARRVRIVGARPPAPCSVVEARLRGRGDGADQVVDAIGYGCPGPTSR